MGAFLVYILKSAFCLAAFYLFYRLLLSRETLHRFNRVALLGVLLLSAVVPLIEVSTEQPSGVGQGMLNLEQWLLLAEAMTEVTSVSVEESRAVWPLVLLSVYALGVLVFLGRNLWSLFRLWQLLRGTRREDIRRYVPDAGGVLLLVHERDIAPFSWMRCIVIARRDLEEDGRPILTHELAHIRRGHSWDLLLADLCIFLQWFNPAAWLLKQELQTVHEYEADEAVLCAGVNAKEYQLLLIKKAVGTRLYSMANSLNHSKLKKRITMMMKEKSSKWACAKYLYVLPLAAVAVVAFARPEVSGVSNQLSDAKVTDLVAIVKEKALKSVPQDSVNPASKPKVRVPRLESYNVPEFPGGEEAQKKFLAENMRYPQEAREKGIEGTVIVSFSLSDETGEIQNPVVVRGVHPALDAEALRLVKAMPRWTVAGNPDKGKLKSVNIEMPIEFKLKGDKSSKVFVALDRNPDFPGGTSALLKYIQKNMRYPENARESHIQGTVVVQFVINEEGQIVEPKVLRSIDPLLDAEALRLVEAMPKWTPGIQDGKATAVRYTLPVQFKLDGGAKASPGSGKEEVKVIGAGQMSDLDLSRDGLHNLVRAGQTNGVDSVFFVIDGVPATGKEFLALTDDDIASITVLKGEAAKKLYGEKAAKRGVLLIATRKKQ